MRYRETFARDARKCKKTDHQHLKAIGRRERQTDGGWREKEGGREAQNG